MASSRILSPKRQAIADSNKTMFLWVAGMSAVIGICIVVSIFLSQQILFKLNVLSKMTETLGTLKDNNKVASELTSNVVVLESNTSLNALKASSEQKALQVILDALPADRNALALGASLQQNLLAGINGLTLDTLSVDSADASAGLTSSGNTIPIQFQVSASNGDAIKEMLLRLERSIRIVDVDSFVLERGDKTYQATVVAHAYYQPEKKVELTETTVPVGGKK